MEVKAVQKNFSEKENVVRFRRVVSITFSDLLLQNDLIIKTIIKA